MQRWLISAFKKVFVRFLIGSNFAKTEKINRQPSLSTLLIIIFISVSVVSVSVASVLVFNRMNDIIKHFDSGSALPPIEIEWTTGGKISISKNTHSNGRALPSHILSVAPRRKKKSIGTQCGKNVPDMADRGLSACMATSGSLCSSVPNEK